MGADRTGQGTAQRLRAVAPRACGLARRIRLAGSWLTMAAAVWISACDEPCITEPCKVEDEPSGIVSNPVPSVTAAAGVTGSAGALAATNVAYVSLPPDSIPNGELAVIRNARTGDSARTAMADGGFDPVPVAATASDTLRLDIQVSGGGTAVRVAVVVPEFRKPRVVRTRPIARKRDVVLNAVPMIVFTEPINRQTIGTGSVRLLRNGAPVSGGVALSADGLRAAFQADQLLAPNTDYVLAVTTGVADLSGDALAQAVQVEFTTGTTTAVATAYTDPAALFSVDGGELRTFQFDAVLHDDGRVTGAFDVFYPASGASLSGSMTCFGIEEGNFVWAAGVVEAATDAGWLGLHAAWRAVDRGPPESSVPDYLSFTVAVNNPQQFCDDRETNPVRPRMFDVERGDIVVRQPTPGEPAALTFTVPPTNVLGDVPIHPPVRLAVVDASGNTVVSFGGSVTIRALDADGATVPLTGATTVTAAGGVAAFQGVGLDRPGKGYKIAATADGLNGVVSGPFDVIVPSPGVIVFSRLGDAGARQDDGLYVMNWDLSVWRLSADADAWPAWSPDGTSIAFQRSSGDSTWIFVMNPDGSGARRLGAGARPAWSPDGGRFAFMSDRDGVGQFELYIMNQDGTGQTKLTTGGVASRASWSPDGTRIVFTAKTDSLASLFVAHADGSNVKLLVDMTRLETCEARDPAWSPDGATIAFQVACIADLRGIYLVRPDGSGLTRLTTLPSRAPVWSPDGRQIAFDRGFESQGRCGGDIWLINADGSGETRLDVTRQGIACSRMATWGRPVEDPNLAGDNMRPAWAPVRRP